MSQHQGLSLFDIGAPSEEVSIGAKNLTVYGIPTDEIFVLLNRFPEAADLIVGGKFGLLVRTPGLIAAIIAAGSGEYENDEARARAEKIAGKLSVAVQLEILAAINRLTFGEEGFGPFVEKLVARLGVVVKSESPGKAPATIFAPPSNASPLTSDFLPSGK